MPTSPSRWSHQFLNNNRISPCELFFELSWLIFSCDFGWIASIYRRACLAKRIDPTRTEILIRTPKFSSLRGFSRPFVSHRALILSPSSRHGCERRAFPYRVLTGIPVSLRTLWHVIAIRVIHPLLRNSGRQLLRLSSSPSLF